MRLKGFVGGNPHIDVMYISVPRKFAVTLLRCDVIGLARMSEGLLSVLCVFYGRRCQPWAFWLHDVDRGVQGVKI